MKSLIFFYSLLNKINSHKYFQYFDFKSLFNLSSGSKFVIFILLTHQNVSIEVGNVKICFISLYQCISVFHSCKHDIYIDSVSLRSEEKSFTLVTRIFSANQPSCIYTHRHITKHICRKNIHTVQSLKSSSFPLEW